MGNAGRRTKHCCHLKPSKKETRPVGGGGWGQDGEGDVTYSMGSVVSNSDCVR